MQVERIPLALLDFVANPEKRERKKKEDFSRRAFEICTVSNFIGSCLRAQHRTLERVSRSGSRDSVFASVTIDVYGKTSRTCANIVR